MMLRRKAFGEFIGTGLLVATVIGSGKMATNISNDVGVQLAINAAATVLSLSLLIFIFSGISGSHFNPVVTVSEFLRHKISMTTAGTYLLTQFLGGFLGAVLANLMFELPAISASHHIRSGGHLWLGEVVATAGLLFLLTVMDIEGKLSAAPLVVSAWIGAAYFFTSSTSFANPAVTFARSWSDSFSGIALQSVPAFVLAQLVGGVIGVALASLLKKGSQPHG